MASYGTYRYQASTSSTGGTVDTGNTWGGWTSVTTTSDTSNVWTTWVGEAEEAVRVLVDGVIRFGQAVQEAMPDAEEFARQVERLATLSAQERVEADKRAEALLLSQLSPEQVESWEAGRWFEVRSQSGKRFVINAAPTMNVDEYDGSGKRTMAHCIVPQQEVPLEDQLLMQKLMLEHAEAEFMRIAKHRRVG